jgi:hypothetical protein
VGSTVVFLRAELYFDKRYDIYKTFQWLGLILAGAVWWASNSFESGFIWANSTSYFIISIPLLMTISGAFFPKHSKINFFRYFCCQLYVIFIFWLDIFWWHTGINNLFFPFRLNSFIVVAFFIKFLNCWLWWYKPFKGLKFDSPYIWCLNGLTCLFWFTWITIGMIFKPELNPLRMDLSVNIPFWGVWIEMMLQFYLGLIFSVINYTWAYLGFIINYWFYQYFIMREGRGRKKLKFYHHLVFCFLLVIVFGWFCYTLIGLKVLISKSLILLIVIALISVIQ